MESIKTAGLDKFGENLQKLVDESSEKRKELHELIGTVIKAELDAKISGSIDDSHSTIRRWQIVAVGSRGGYVAIRPVSSDESNKKKKKKTGTKNDDARDSPGAVTNYLTNGFNRRKPSTAQRSRAVSTGRIEGRRFYEHTESRAQQIAMREAERWAKELTQELSKID